MPFWWRTCCALDSPSRYNTASGSIVLNCAAPYCQLGPGQLVDFVIPYPDIPMSSPIVRWKSTYLVCTSLCRDAAREVLASYGPLPYEALYTGYFLDSASARQYSMIFKPLDDPYEKGVLAAQQRSMHLQIEV